MKRLKRISTSVTICTIVTLFIHPVLTIVSAMIGGLLVYGAYCRYVNTLRDNYEKEKRNIIIGINTKNLN